MVLLSSSRFSLDLLMKSTTSFSNIRMLHNCPKIKRASSCRKSFSKTTDFSNAPTPVVISTSCSLAMTALHPMDEKQDAWGVFQDKPDTECTPLDTVTSPMVSLPPVGFPCGYLACQARSAPATSTGSPAGATHVAHPP